MDKSDQVHIPLLEAIEQDVARLIEANPKAGAASFVSALIQLTHIRARVRTLRRSFSAVEAADIAVLDAIRAAIADLGQTTDGRVAAALTPENVVGLVARQEAAAAATGVDVKTIRRAGQLRAASAVARRIYQRELVYLSKYSLPAALHGDDPLLRILWSTRSSADVLLVHGEIPAIEPHSRGAFNIQAGDVQALLEAYVALREMKPSGDVSLLPSNAVHGAQLGCNVVSVGGPRWNVVTRALLNRLDPPWKFAGTPGSSTSGLLNQESGEQLTAVTDESGEVLQTHGFIVCAPNPFNDSNRVTIIAGLSTLGVLAATRCVIPPAEDQSMEVLNLVESAYGDHLESGLLQIVVSTAVIDGEVVPASISKESIYVTEALSSERIKR